MNDDRRYDRRVEDHAAKARKDEIGIAKDLSDIPPVNNQIYQDLGLLHDSERAKKLLLELTPKEEAELNWRVNHMLWLKKAIKRKRKKWVRNHVKACINKGCCNQVDDDRKKLPNDAEECPECGAPARWFKMDEQGNPTDLEQKRTEPAKTIEDGWPIVHKKARNIIDRAVKRLKSKMIDRATGGNGQDGNNGHDLRK